MSKVSLAGNVSGTGVFTIASPNSNVDRTLTLPDATGTVQVSGNPITGTTANFSGNVTLGSSVLGTPTGSAPAYLCRAWVNFNGTGTVAIRASGNVSSITDNGTGDYTANFTTAMLDASFCFQVTAGALAGQPSEVRATAASTSTCRLNTCQSNGTAVDGTEICVSIFR